MGKPYSRFAVVIAGRRSGKTEIAKRELVLALCEKKPWSDPRYFYAAPTRDQARRIAWRDFKALVPPEWVADISETHLVIETVFGSELHVVGMDKPERIEGPPWDGGIEDETCDQKTNAFNATIYPALADRLGWCWRIGVPKRRGPSAREVKETYGRAARKDLKDWLALTWPSSTVLSAETLADARDKLDAKTYREQFEASWETAGGAIYYAFDSAYNVRPCFYDPNTVLLIGSDFNVDPMCWTIAQERPSGIVEIIDEIVLSNANTPMTLEELKKRYPNHAAGFEFYGDATGKARKTSASSSDYQLILNHPFFVKAGRTVHYPGANPKHPDRYATVNTALCTASGRRRLFIDPKCHKIIDDLIHVYEDEGTGDAAQVADMVHMSDALGYLLMYKLPLSTVLMEDRIEAGLDSRDDERFSV